ncbi:MAG TPA: aminotransferase class I/II-fold pyridoxal phosphate-dependent enzyme [Clostridia bacterium]|nr:aminotransferase class I/II-fold pyridoxal phosphate-dependent enzyme [Clostridia bacterium]
MKRSPRADSTRCVHAGEDRHGKNGPLTTEIAQTAVFALKSTDELRRYAAGAKDLFLYSRYGNPTVRAAEEKIAALEGAEDCVLTSSGMSAEMATALTVCKSGDEIVSMLDIYGGTTKLFANVLPRCGIKTTFVPFDDLARISRYFTRRTKMLFLETPTNPTLRCASIEELAAQARKRGITVVVDNTFATPILQKPLRHGADIVIHSATKYLGGHSDLTAGAAVGARKWIDAIRATMVQTGANSDALIAYLLLRGLKTLEVRVARACVNAFHVAEFLSGHSKVGRVFYPGTPGSETQQVALRQMQDFGMMVSFDIKGGGRAAECFIDALRLWYLAPSLGGVESTVSYPVLTSHIDLTARELKLLGVSPATVRLSVGIEDSADLLADLEQALAKA